MRKRKQQWFWSNSTRMRTLQTRADRILDLLLHRSLKKLFHI